MFKILFNLICLNELSLFLYNSCQAILWEQPAGDPGGPAAIGQEASCPSVLLLKHPQPEPAHTRSTSSNTFGLVNPFQGQMHPTPVAGYGANAVLTSTLGRSGSRARSSSVGHSRSASQASISTVGETPGGGGIVNRSASSSRVNSAVVSEKGRINEPAGHVRRSSHSGVAYKQNSKLHHGHELQRWLGR